jgi:hypothetical protein
LARGNEEKNKIILKSSLKSDVYSAFQFNCLRQVNLIAGIYLDKAHTQQLYCPFKKDTQKYQKYKNYFKLNWQCADKSHEQFLIAGICCISPQFVFMIKP